MIKIDTKTIVTIGVAAALYGALGFVGIPVGPNTQLKPAIALLAIFSALFGPLVGFSMGFIGHMLTDMIAGWGIWWGWVASSGIMGLFMGLVFKCKKFSSFVKLSSVICLLFNKEKINLSPISGLKISEISRHNEKRLAPGSCK